MHAPEEGFSLIELMITVAIIGILSTIAYPSYQQYVVRGDRANGQQFLMDLAQRQEQFLIDSRKYGSVADLNMALPAGVAQDFDLSITLNGDDERPFFQAVLAPKSTLMSNDGSLFINNRGERWRDAGCATDPCLVGSTTAIPWK